LAVLANKLKESTGQTAIQMKRENRRWGYKRIAGELRKLGVKLDPTTVRNILRRHGLSDPGKEVYRGVNSSATMPIR
jgi:transposase